MTRTTQITGMTAALALFAAIAMAFTPAALAGEKANKDASAQTAPNKALDRTEPHGGVMTEKLGEEVPTMTSDEKPAAESGAPESQTYTGTVGEVVPTMKAPEDKKNTTGAGSASGADLMGSTEEAITLTSQQAQDWVGKTVYSSNGKKVGEVAAFARGSDDKVSEMHIDIGGFLGIGETRVKLMPNQFKLLGDRATIDMTSDQAKDLPRVK